MIDLPPRDDAARRDVETELDTSFLVEAGAGAGKTTLLVKRLLLMMERHCTVDRIAAVTFTRKAANELRQKFQEGLEKRLEELRGKQGDAGQIARLDAALRDIDQAFIGTIHAFCGRLLREHPLEAQIDPGFRELDELEAPLRERAFWDRWIARCRSEGTTEWRALAEVGIDPRRLYKAFSKVVQNPDVTFDAPPLPMPDPAPVQRALTAFDARVTPQMPTREPDRGWCPVQRTVRRLRWLKSLNDWSDPVQFCVDMEGVSKSGMKATLDRWPSAEAHDIRAEAAELFQSVIAPLQRAWYEHRYDRVLAFLQRAARAYQDERFATGQLTFEDLLLGAARLLRTSPESRRALGERWRYVLVDEFQDTDPMQAEVCLLLASDPGSDPADAPGDWRHATPRSGALVVVGDPKQSIYRFRRADIRTYEFVKQRFQAFGRVKVLTENFRSVHPIADVVNAHFGAAFPSTSSDAQAAYAPMMTRKDPRGTHEGVFTYEPGGEDNDDIVKLDADRVASWIAERVRLKQREPGDFLVLTLRRDPLEEYANAIARHDLPVTTSGATLLQELELRELVVVLRALAQPSSPLPVAAALEGLFFGLSPADLWEARRAGVEFRLGAARDASQLEGAASRVAAALDTLRDWWRVSQREPVDLLLSRILDATGLLPFAASQPLGDNRGGALLHLIEAVRGAASNPAPDLRSAIETIENALATEAPDALLMPGRHDAVRVMNLHKAKGLEARVVILAAPCRYKKHEPDFCIARDDEGRAHGFLLVKDERKKLLAQPRHWESLSAVEATFMAAEKTRLLYVAATRAKYELLVARSNLAETATLDPAWLALAPVLDAKGGRLALEPSTPPARRVADVTVEAMVAQAGELATRRALARAAGWSRRTVTQETKRPLEASSPDDHARNIGRGKQWGTVVHRVLEARARGRTGESLARFADAVLRDEEVTGATAADIVRLVQSLEAEGFWAPGTVAEMPIVTCETEDDRLVLREGVIDVARPDGDGWQVLDWKTDLDRTGGDPKRRAMYQGQVDAYAVMWATLLGVRARGDLVGLGGTTPAA